jgi:4-diphosphocytidyl-2-C-methyl-D-erythritol kinase
MLVLPANAKLNLALAVIARRDDGWHDLDTIVMPIDWHDLVGVDLNVSPRAVVSLRLTGPAADGVPAGEENLVVRAGRALVEAAVQPLAVDIWLDKHVPYAAGLGGGSADAAATLRAGLRLLTKLRVTFDEQRLNDATSRLGSDVPALFAQGPQRITGRGDVTGPVVAPDLHVVVVSTEPSVTAAVYAQVAPDELTGKERLDRMAETLAGGRQPDDSLLGSALEPAAVRANPALARALDRARGVIAGYRWHLTGSGGALFSLVDSAHKAENVARRMRESGFRARACVARGRSRRAAEAGTGTASD